MPNLTLIQFRLADLGNPRNNVLTEKGLESKKWLPVICGNGSKNNVSSTLFRGWICFLYGKCNRLLNGHSKEI